MTTSARIRPSAVATSDETPQKQGASGKRSSQATGHPAKSNGSKTSRAKSTRVKSPKKRLADVAVMEDLGFEPDEFDPESLDAGSHRFGVSGNGAGRTASEESPEPDSTDEAESGTTAALSDDVGEHSAPTGGGSPWRGSLAIPRWMAAGLAFLTLALAVVLLVTLMALGSSGAQASARTSALSAARAYAVDLAGYNYRDLGRDFGVVVAHSTPSFRRNFTQSSDALKATLTQYHATAQAKVVSAGVVSATTARAVVLVFLDQTISNSTQSSATTDQSEVEITLVDSGGRWLIDQVQLL